MEFYFHFLALVLSSCFSCAAASNSTSTGQEWMFWVNMSREVIFIVASIIIAAIFSLVSWCVCSIHTRCRKDKVNAALGCNVMALPIWSRSLMVDFGMQQSGFLEMSDGLKDYVTYNRVVRHRAGTTPTDGARWSIGLTAGKHVFEILWPWSGRGKHATVGVGTAEAPLKARGDVSLVGGCQHSWGLDLVLRRVVHKRKLLKTCPTDGSYVPDKFFMFVDMDEGLVGFGNDVTFWGFVIENLPVNGTDPYYVMVGTSRHQADIQVYYKGTACTGGFDPFTPTGAAQASTSAMPGAPPAYDLSLPPPPGYVADDKGAAHTSGQKSGVSVVPSAPDRGVLYVSPPPPYQEVQPIPVAPAPITPKPDSQQ